MYVLVGIKHFPYTSYTLKYKYSAAFAVLFILKSTYMVPFFPPQIIRKETFNTIKSPRETTHSIEHMCGS